jgi:hypothetical protein
MTGRLSALVAVSLVLLWALITACGGSSSDSNPSQTRATGTSQATQAGRTTASGQAAYDVTISGGLSAEWKSGANDSSGASCVVANDGYAALSLYGLIAGTQYGLGYSQNQFAAGSYAYPASSSATEAPPLIQIATSSNSSVDWTAGPAGEGSGTAVVTGAGGSEVTLALDLDLTPRTGGSLVHVKGTLVCPPS